MARGKNLSKKYFIIIRHLTPLIQSLVLAEVLFTCFFFLETFRFKKNVSNVLKFYLSTSSRHGSVFHSSSSELRRYNQHENVYIPKVLRNWGIARLISSLSLSPSFVLDIVKLGAGM